MITVPDLFAPIADTVVAPFYTAVLDLTQTGSTLIVPGVSGKIFVPSKLGFVVVSVTGTPTTPVTFQMGDNASTYNNILASTSSVLTTAAMVANTETNASGLATAQVKTPGGGTFVNVTAGGAGSGGFTLTGRFFMCGFYVPVS